MNKWYPIHELQDKYKQDLLLYSPDLIDGDTNELGVSMGFYQDDEGWICIGWDMHIDEPVRVVVNPTHFQYLTKPEHMPAYGDYYV